MRIRFIKAELEMAYGYTDYVYDLENLRQKADTFIHDFEKFWEDEQESIKGDQNDSQ
jgi:hypothetical protein